MLNSKTNFLLENMRKSKSKSRRDLKFVNYNDNRNMFVKYKNYYYDNDKNDKLENSDVVKSEHTEYHYTNINSHNYYQNFLLNIVHPFKITSISSLSLLSNIMCIILNIQNIIITVMCSSLISLFKCLVSYLILLCTFLHNIIQILASLLSFSMFHLKSTVAKCSSVIRWLSKSITRIIASSNIFNNSLLIVVSVVAVVLVVIGQIPIVDSAINHRQSQEHNRRQTINNIDRSNVTDLVVNVGEDVMLECAWPNRQYGGGIDDPINNAHYGVSGGGHRGNNHNHNNNHRLNGNWTYEWCRYESAQSQHRNQSMVNSKLKLTLINLSTKHPKKNYLRHCFIGRQYFIVNEDRVTTVIYRCSVYRNLPHNNNNTTKPELVAIKKFKLYVDQFSRVPNKREITSSLFSLSHPSQSSMLPLRQKPPHSSSRPANCKAPRCKPYAVAIRAHCTSIELTIRYPSSQYGYNQTIDDWGTVMCNDQIGGYQIWLIGYGIVKKFLPTDQIILDQLIPGKRYCFNGWAYNACGPGPVFTLEGVCAKNDAECHSSSDEHCELDLDYSY